MAKIVQRGHKVSVGCVCPLHIRNRVAESTEKVAVGTHLHAPWQCTLARIRSKLLVTNRYWSNKSASAVTIPSKEGHELVAVELDEGDEVCVSLQHLIAFSEQVRFRTVLDFGIAAWAIQKNCQHLAKGPGILVFDCAGQPAVWNAEDTTETHRIQLNRLVMWPKDITIRLDKVHTNFDLYWGETRVFVEHGNKGIPLILDVDHQSEQSSSLLDIIARLYRPW